MTIFKQFAKALPFGCLFVFAIPFAAAGAALAAFAVYEVIQSIRMTGWEERPATVLSAELEVVGDHDAPTYRAIAEYEYQYAGRKYSGARVAIDDNSDGIGEFNQNAYHILSEHQKTGRPFRCFVNTANPSEAVLFRNVRWGIVGVLTLTALVFGSAGFGMLSFAVIGFRKNWRESKLAARYPDKPWLWRADWAAGRIVCSDKRELAVLWLVAIGWNSLSYVLLVGLFNRQTPPVFYLSLIFPLIGALILAMALSGTIQLMKYGKAIFQMDSVPGIIGGKLAGVVFVHSKLQPEKGCRFKLQCIWTEKQGRSSTEHIEWEDAQIVADRFRQIDPTKAAVPVQFDIPGDCEEPTNASRGISWRLELDGGDYQATFDVPVFKTSEVE